MLIWAYIKINLAPHWYKMTF